MQLESIWKPVELPPTGHQEEYSSEAFQCWLHISDPENLFTVYGVIVTVALLRDVKHIAAGVSPK